jgi:hypothetical protein
MNYTQKIEKHVEELEKQLQSSAQFQHTMSLQVEAFSYLFRAEWIKITPPIMQGYTDIKENHLWILKNAISTYGEVCFSQGRGGWLILHRFNFPIEDKVYASDIVAKKELENFLNIAVSQCGWGSHVKHLIVP